MCENNEKYYVLKKMIHKIYIFFNIFLLQKLKIYEYLIHHYYLRDFSSINKKCHLKCQLIKITKLNLKNKLSI